MKFLTVIGARPQFIKAAVISRAIQVFNEHRLHDGQVHEVVVHTGQHYDDEMSSIFFRELGMPTPDYHLGIGSGPHGRQTGRMLEALEPVLQRERPDWVLVYGDTNSTLAGALAASKLGLPIAHVEAGLRSYNRSMPEETNRVLTDHLSALLFCPTARAVKNLSCEGIVAGVHQVGDVMFDSLRYYLARTAHAGELHARLGVHRGDYALATVHRAETTDRPECLSNIVDALGRLGILVVWPLHPRTKAALERTGLTRLPETVYAIPPVSYLEMLALQRDARVILTDSGGVQKEAFWLGVPCVTFRRETEWEETVEAGWNCLAGTDPERIVAAVQGFFAELPTQAGIHFGDGHAAERILEVFIRTMAER